MRDLIDAGFAALEAPASADPRRGAFCFGGAKSTLADVYLVPQVESARGAPRSISSSYPHIVAIDRACAELEAFRRAAPAVQPDAGWRPPAQPNNDTHRAPPSNATRRPAFDDIPAPRGPGVRSRGRGGFGVECAPLVRRAGAARFPRTGDPHAYRLSRSRRRSGSGDLDRILRAHRHPRAAPHHARRARLRQADALPAGPAARSTGSGLPDIQAGDRRHGADGRARSDFLDELRDALPGGHPLRHLLRVRHAADGASSAVPTLFCHRLEADARGLRGRTTTCAMPDQKRAGGASASRSSTSRSSPPATPTTTPPCWARRTPASSSARRQNVVDEFPQFPVTRDYAELQAAIDGRCRNFVASAKPRAVSAARVAGCGCGNANAASP
ncbi:MAG: hypothetical protein MZV65_48775 [Chromatiales bacterium]|nr:hypothetical protein [Chromatiales bacterium]